MTGIVDDAIDRLLVRLLINDGRATLRTLSEAAGLSISATQARVRRLESEGIIQGYGASVDPSAIGLPLAAFIAISPLDPAQPDDTPARLAGLSAIESCHSVAGAYSYILSVRVASPQALEQLIRDIRRIARVQTQTTVVLQTFFSRPSSPLPID
ncbi:MAG: Lrp/AsnC family transcriptional regulator [Actinobacteria bacterium]|nr:Lrp/AsnC family transcriptional regulator [Actinomycetota bacterium]